MASPIVDTTFTSGTTITSNWLNGVNDAINDATQDITGATARTVVSKLADTISVKDFGAVGDGVTDDTNAFNAAAAVGTTIYVPQGDYLISAPTSNAFWYLQDGAYISGLPDVNGINDVSRLTGRIFYIENEGDTGIRVGSSGMWVENEYNYTQSIAEMSVLSTSGTPALIVGTRTSDDGVPTNEGAYAIGAFGINDYTAGRQACWGIYTNVTRYAGSGVAHNEFDMENFDSPGQVSPISQDAGMATNLWVSNGHGNASAYAGSAFLASQPNPKGWQRGIVIKDGSLDDSANPFGIKEAMCLPVDSEITYYQNVTGVVDTIYARYTSDRVENTTFRNGVYPRYISTARPATGNTLANTQVFGGNYYGYDGSGPVMGVDNSIIAKTNVTGGNGRFAWQMQAMNSGGGYTGIALNINGNSRFTPMSDNSVALGQASYRWSVVYAGTGTINTSDENEKTDIRPLDYKEKAVALAIKARIKAFKFKDAVDEKGNNARIHFGVLAQDVKAAFEAEGLVAEEYGVFCSDTLDDGTVRLGVRYDELFAFIIGSI